MNKIIIARFDSVDMATIAARNVMDRIKGITDVKVAYKNEDREEEDELFSDLFTPPRLVNGVMIDGTPFIPINNYAVRDKEHESDTPEYVRVEIKTNNENVLNIKSTLRAYGGYDIREFH